MTPLAPSQARPFRSHRARTGAVWSVRDLRRRGGYGVLQERRPARSACAPRLYDARGHGTSEGRGFVTILSFVDDLWAAVDLLRDQRRDVDPDRIAVAGHSMGGAAAIVAAVGRVSGD